MASRPHENFAKFLRERLASMRFATVAVLRQVIREGAPGDIASLHFVVLDNPTEQFPLALFGVDQNAIPLNRDNSSYIERVSDRIESLPQLFDEQEGERFIIWETIDEKGPVHALHQPMDGWEDAVFIPWFAECWNNAGGEAFAVPTTIGTRTDVRTILR